MRSEDICIWQCALNPGASLRLSQQGVDRTWRRFSVTDRVALLSTRSGQIGRHDPVAPILAKPLCQTHTLTHKLQQQRPIGDMRKKTSFGDSGFVQTVALSPALDSPGHEGLPLI